jgi:hypothetical protein
MTMLSWIFQSRPKLNPIEMRVIEAVAAALPQESAALLRIQVSLINKVQRIDQDREVDFYHIENGKPTFPDTALFPNRTEEFELAKVHLNDVATGHQSKATVSLVKGRLFCIEFSQTPRDLRGLNDLKIEIEQLNDPMNTGEPNTPGVPHKR